MSKFRESRTAKYLLTAFSAEAQARTRYDFYATKAEADGYIQVAKIFSETALQEYEHALRFFKFFNGGELDISWKFPAGAIQDTHANLIASAELELTVHTDMYPFFASVAEEEGFQRAADTLNAISVAEENHEAVFWELADGIANQTLFDKKEAHVWRCINCGYIHTGKTPPKKCPACVKPEGHFELFIKNW